jgi:hypothetical protein
MTTKKIFYSSVLALLLCACINETIQSPVSDSGKAVGFGTVLAPSTRGKVFTKDSLQKTANGFSVVAYNTDTASWKNYDPSTPNFMNNVPVTWNSITSAWGYSPIKYWPGKVDNTNEGYGKVTFFALAGREKGNNTITYNSSSKKHEFSYTTAAAAAEQKDLIADVLFNQTYSTNSGKVDFKFNHILSRIGFTATLKNQYENVTVKVTSLRVVYADGKVKNAGTYAFSTNEANSTDAEGEWTPGSTFLSGNSGDLRVGADDVTLDNDATPAVTPLNADSLYLMIIPQALGAGDLTLEFTYTVEAGGETITYFVPYPLPAPTPKYELGKQYIYNFTLTLHAVEFESVDVIDWVNAPTEITL